MKWVLIAVALLLTSTAQAGYGTGGVPSVPCYLDGEYQGTLPINECKRIGGTIPGEKVPDKKKSKP
ncbi:hypothetical protein [Vibrio superstes]|uniref:Uncharacterized protein n=1 Tax=Vibrio superstes NBRC 103154 TaxID=1219062 RepID=A0A511QNW9_9VIBR|nr:hypothetical protein [Vibrio superstes]GEM79023.1 hypothetical protein VSU01S_12680 [Vibrio superstes NBRC 103154]